MDKTRDFKDDLLRFMLKGGRDGFFFDEWTPVPDWHRAYEMVKAGLLKHRRVITGSATFELTAAGRELLSVDGHPFRKDEYLREARR